MTSAKELCHLHGDTVLAVEPRVGYVGARGGSL